MGAVRRPDLAVVDCVYATQGWGVHDERWVSALRSLGHEPLALSLGRDADSMEDLRRQVTSAGSVPVLAGPLGTVTRGLVDLPGRIVGLSWGFDLHELAAADDTAWLRGLSALVVDSPATRAIALDAGVDAQSITLLPWGIALDAFPMNGEVMSPGEVDLPADVRLIVSLRAHEALYRIADIIDAFALVARTRPQAALVVGHSGSLTDALKERARSLGLADRVRFIGTLPEGRLAPLLRGAACYVTAAEVDGTSVTLLQAMASGAPIVASATPGNTAWIENGRTGSTFSVGDIQSLATAISSAIDWPSMSMRRAAREEVVRRANWVRNLPALDAALFPPA